MFDKAKNELQKRIIERLERENKELQEENEKLKLDIELFKNDTAEGKAKLAEALTEFGQKNEELEKILHEDITGHDGGEKASVQETVKPLEYERVDRQPVHNPVDLRLVAAAELLRDRGGKLVDDIRNSILRQGHEQGGIGGSEDQSGQEAYPASESVRILHRYVVKFLAEIQHVFLHQEDAAEKFHGPQDDGGRLDEEGGVRESGSFLQEQAYRRKRAEDDTGARRFIPDGMVVHVH